LALAQPFFRKASMSIDTPAAADVAPFTAAPAVSDPARHAWIGTALAVTFAVGAVLLVSFVAVMTTLA